MKKEQILVVEDDLQLQRLLRAQLLALGFEVYVVERGEDGILAAAEFEPDLILLSLNLPGINGLETCKRLREWTRTPIIALCGLDRSKQDPIQRKIEALDTGADDCVTKPFCMAELLARMRAVFRRTRDWSAAPVSQTPLLFGNLTVDFVNRHVFLDNRPLHLTPTEYELLHVLASHAGQVLTHRELLMRVWGQDAACDTQYLHTYISQLRRKLEPYPNSHRHLFTEPGIGYRFSTQP